MTDNYFHVIITALLPMVNTGSDDPNPNIMEAINAEEIGRIKKLEEKLSKDWTMKEIAEMDLEKTKKKDQIEKESASLHKEIQSITGEHYLKTDDKDITALQENDTSIAHKVSDYFLL